MGALRHEAMHAASQVHDEMDRLHDLVDSLRSELCRVMQERDEASETMALVKRTSRSLASALDRTAARLARAEAALRQNGIEVV